MFHAPLAGASTSRRQPSDVEAEERDIAVLHYILAAFEPHLSAFSSGGVRSRRDEVIVGDDLRLDEPALDVAVDDARGLRCPGPLANRPGPHLRIAGGQKGHEVQQAVGGVDERRERRLLQARVLEEYRRLLVRQLTDLR